MVCVAVNSADKMVNGFGLVIVTDVSLIININPYSEKLLPQNAAAHESTALINITTDKCIPCSAHRTHIIV